MRARLFVGGIKFPGRGDVEESSQSPQGGEGLNPAVAPWGPHTKPREADMTKLIALRLAGKTTTAMILAATDKVGGKLGLERRIAR